MKNVLLSRFLTTIEFSCLSHHNIVNFATTGEPYHMWSFYLWFHVHANENCPFYPLIHSNPWSLYTRIRCMRDLFFGSYFSKITRSTCTWKTTVHLFYISLHLSTFIKLIAHFYTFLISFPFPEISLIHLLSNNYLKSKILLWKKCTYCKD